MLEKRLSMQQRSCHYFMSKLKSILPSKAIVQIFDEMESKEPGSSMIFQIDEVLRKKGPLDTDPVNPIMALSGRLKD